MVRNPLQLSETPATYRLGPPELGTAGDEIREWLGFSPAVPDRQGVGSTS